MSSGHEESRIERWARKGYRVEWREDPPGYHIECQRCGGRSVERFVEGVDRALERHSFGLCAVRLLALHPDDSRPLKAFQGVSEPVSDQPLERSKR